MKAIHYQTGEIRNH